MPTKRAVVRPPTPLEEEFKKGFDQARDAEEDEEETSPPAMKAAAPETLKVKRGWGEAQRQMDSTSSYAQAFKPDADGNVIKFLEDDPYAGFKRHWIRRSTKDGETTRAYTCMRSFVGEGGKPKECPLCEIGDKPQAVSCFNIALLSEDGSLAVKSWEMGAKVYNLAKAFADNPRIGPLSKNFYLVSKTGQRQQVQYNMSPVKATALEEDYDIPVPSDAALNALDLYTEDIVQITPVKELRELSQELVDDYE